MGVTARVAALALCALACACSSGSGGGGGSSSGASKGDVRLVAVPREALSPSASPMVWLFVQARAGAAPGAFQLEESGDGVHFSPVATAPAAVLTQAAHWELPAPAGVRWYRVTAPKRSNAVRVQGPTGAAPPAITSPAPGAAQVAHEPLVVVSGTAAHRSYLYAIADESGALVWLEESSAASHAPTSRGGTTFIGDTPLAPGAPHLVTVIALDDGGWGISAARRIDFTTAP
jgi:hypothetical protein